MANSERPSARARLRSGLVIPAHPLVLTGARMLDERRQRALSRYYIDAGAGGMAVGVHTTQFAIRDAKVGLFQTVLELAMEVADNAVEKPVMVAGVVGRTPQARAEAEIAAALGYDAGLLSLGAWAADDDAAILDHCREIADIIPLFGFYLQPAVGGRALGYSFWREFAEIPGVWAIKVAPFDRYKTIDVVRAVVDAGRDDIALYTGNDDSIVADLLTPFRFHSGGREVTRYFDGGLLGQFAVWTRAAGELVREIRRARDAGAISPELLSRGAALTDVNAAIFDPAHGFSGCIPGIHEVLRREGLLEGTWCLDTRETLSPGQADEISRVTFAYPYLTDDAFVRENVDRWLS